MTNKIMKARFFLFVLVPLFLLTGCATPQDTGPATTYITKNIPLEKVRGEIIRVYTGGGWNLEKETDHMLTFFKENKNVAAQFIFGSNYDTRVFNRETVIITDSVIGINLTATQNLVSNYGSAFERSRPCGSGGQEKLDEIRYDLMQ